MPSEPSKDPPRSLNRFTKLQEINALGILAFSPPTGSRGFKMGPRRPKRAPTEAQDGPKTAPRAPKSAPRVAQEGPKTAFWGYRGGGG